MSGRNWTRRSIEELIDEFLKKKGSSGGGSAGDIGFMQPISMMNYGVEARTGADPNNSVADNKQFLYHPFFWDTEWTPGITMRAFRGIFNTHDSAYGYRFMYPYASNRAGSDYRTLPAYWNSPPVFSSDVLYVVVFDLTPAMYYGFSRCVGDDILSNGTTFRYVIGSLNPAQYNMLIASAKWTQSVAFNLQTDYFNASEPRDYTRVSASIASGTTFFDVMMMDISNWSKVPFWYIPESAAAILDSYINIVPVGQNMLNKHHLMLIGTNPGGTTNVQLTDDELKELIGMIYERA